MCVDCGCPTSDDKHQAHDHHHGHDHHRGHGHHHGHHHHGDGHEHAQGEPHRHDGEQTRDKAQAARKVLVETDILAKNNRMAEGNRALFREKGLFVLNLVSSPGSGKTTMLERSLKDLAGSCRCAVIEGDQQTDNDAVRIAATGVPVKQINTGAGCHLDAHMVLHAAESFDLDNLDLLLIENVGNLVCPASFDLEACKEMARRVSPGIRIFEVSSKTGAGMDAWYAWLGQAMERAKG